MSMEQYWTENNRNFSSIFSDSSSDEESAMKNHMLDSNMVLRDSNIGESSDSSVEARIVKSGEAVPVRSGKLRTKVVQGKNRCSKTKSTTKKSSFRGAGKKRSKCCTYSASAAMEDLRKFSKSVINDLKVKSQQMLEEMKKELINLEAAESSKRTKNKGKGILKTSQPREHKSTHPVPSTVLSEPQYEQHRYSSFSRNVIQPAGQDAYNTGFNYGRNISAPNAVHQHGYFTNLLAEAMGSGNSPYLHRNSIQTSGMGSRFPLSLHQRLGSTSHVPYPTVAGISSGDRNRRQTSGMGSRFPLSLHQRLGSTSHVPYPTVAGISSGGNTFGWNLNGGPTVFYGSGHDLSNNVVANNLRSNLNSRANEALRRMHDPRYGNFH